MEYLTKALQSIQEEMYAISMSEGENSLRYFELHQIEITLQITLKKHYT